MNHQCNYAPSRQEITLSKSNLILSYFEDKSDYESMKLNMDSQTKIEELQEDEIPVLIELDKFKPLLKFKVTACIYSPPSTLSKHINTLPNWSRILIQNYKEENLGPSLL